VNFVTATENIEIVSNILKTSLKYFVMSSVYLSYIFPKYPHNIETIGLLFSIKLFALVHLSAFSLTLKNLVNT